MRKQICAIGLAFLSASAGCGGETGDAAEFMPEGEYEEGKEDGLVLGGVVRGDRLGPTRFCPGTPVSPDVATDGQRVYVDSAQANQRAQLVGYRYNDAPPSTTRPQGEGREAIYAGCQFVQLESARDPDGVIRTRPYITVPRDAPTGDYALKLLPAGSPCPAGGIRATPIDTSCVSPTLSVTRSYMVSTSDYLRVIGNSEGDSDNPAEMQFAFAARAGAAFGNGGTGDSLVKWSGSFPGGGDGAAHLTNDDNTLASVELPLFVGREGAMNATECREECVALPAASEAACAAQCTTNENLGRYNDQLDFTMAGVEYDSSPSKWWGYLAGAVTTGLGCALSIEVGIPKEGCAASLGLGGGVATAVNSALADDDDNMGVVSATHRSNSNDWNEGVPMGPIRFGGSTRESGAGEIDLYYRNRRVGAPRILSYAVRLKSIRVTDDYEENNCGGPAEVFVNARASLHQGEASLPGTTRLPSPTTTWSIAQGATNTFGGVPQQIGGQTFSATMAPESPFLYIEMGVWEDDQDKDLMGIFADTVMLSDLFGSRYDSTEETTSEGFRVRRVKTQRSATVHGYAGSDNHCWSSIFAHAWNPHAIEGGAELVYEIEAVWLKAPSRQM